MSQGVRLLRNATGLEMVVLKNECTYDSKEYKLHYSQEHVVLKQVLRLFLICVCNGSR